MQNRLCRNGITLISLVIIVIALMMIAGIITYVSYDIISETKKTTFLNDLSSINDAVDEYYSVNGSLPTLKGGNQITVTEYKQKINELYGKEALDSLISELELNDDLASNFFQIDMNKINVDSSKFGIRKDETDIFLISSNNNIYYYSGYELQKKIYFSMVKIIDKKI